MDVAATVAMAGKLRPKRLIQVSVSAYVQWHQHSRMSLPQIGQILGEGLRAASQPWIRRASRNM